MATATKMHPADALLEGRRHVPRNSRSLGYFLGRTMDTLPQQGTPIGAACATGAMAIGYGLVKPTASVAQAMQYGSPRERLGRHDSRLEAGAHCPARGCADEYTQLSVLDVVLELNDSHEWEQRRIADWLRRVIPA
jgi:hypothetical protein